MPVPATRLRRRKTRTIFISAILLLSVWVILQTLGSSDSHSRREALWQEAAPSQHPLDGVIAQAQESHEANVQKETHTLSDAVEAYKQRRGRYPPPGFDKWYARAKRDNSMLVESFFDQIYEDLEPFWGISPAVIGKALSGWYWTLSVRDGKVQDVPQGRFRSRVWGQMLAEISSELPDIDIAINPLDEPRVVAPWDIVDAAMTKASQQRAKMMSLPGSQIQSKIPVPYLHNGTDKRAPIRINSTSLWPTILKSCPPPQDKIRTEDTQDLQVGNWTAAKNLCQNQHWANMHGALIEPETLSITTSLVPMFSTTKFQGFNDLLLPPPSYYSDDPLFTGQGWLGTGSTSTPWHKKLHGLIWRGKATGGHSREHTWRKFHRHRLVSMLNASDIPSHLANSAIDIISPDPTPGNVNDEFALSEWLRLSADASFTDLPSQKGDSALWQAVSQHYSVSAQVPMKKQYHWKYVPDIDGNSLSGRFRAFLQSNSSPMKATIFKEWHDSRLVPWVHFIPLDITLRDLWYHMAYFLGFGGSGAHDKAGEKIANDGREWALKVLRKDDMRLYMYRVLLEYARLCDEERDNLGFVEGETVAR